MTNWFKEWYDGNMFRAKKIISIVAVVVVVLSLALLAGARSRNINIVSVVKHSPTIIRTVLSDDEAGTVPLSGEKDGIITIALLGIAGERSGNPAPYLTDTLLVAKIRIQDGTAKRVSLVSLPRDLYVQIPHSEEFTKINGLYLLGRERLTRDPEQFILQKLEDITGLPIQYFVVFDMKTVENIIDRLDGLSVYVPEDVSDPRFPDQSFGYEPFSVQKGWQYMDGRTALRYMRTRNTIEGDLGRMKRQQHVVDAVRKKVYSLNLFWDMDKLLGIYEEIKENVITDMTEQNIRRIWTLARGVPFDSITMTAIGSEEAKHLVKEDHIPMGNVAAFVFIPAEGIEQYGAIRSYIENK